eukprot:CAMPEP_0113307424 /NCGR_PEP_ID=MMETSP0010_2-20120614/6274_1 /TAXON_ID=216773 ORGANISM="Corethron hystrix, Strain 308" /NCGR_SAMPLE_ID=MMETSP0010_2 /ASSEMBLY_ACC=CAM_ASM_000155 /LENGTH=231 /DNA_ID=CAMNT_0000162275 /DNA_START=77 /DNA_END=772 /DNA_ORIENTATION=+ /assembly_acc=CAM_ASM_000155
MTRFLTAAFLLLALAPAAAWVPAAHRAPRPSAPLSVGKDPNVQMGGNTWKPDSATMGSTDTPDFFPDDYDPDAAPDFTEGMMGSQAKMGGGGTMGTALPGLENVGADAVMMGGIEEISDIPADIKFVPMSVPDDVIEIDVAASSSGLDYDLLVKPMCMTFEDFYAGFSDDSHPMLSVSPRTGRMDRRGGEISVFTVTINTTGQAGKFEGDLVIILPEDNSKLSYKFKVNAY